MSGINETRCETAEGLRRRARQVGMQYGQALWFSRRYQPRHWGPFPMHRRRVRELVMQCPMARGEGAEAGRPSAIMQPTSSDFTDNVVRTQNATMFPSRVGRECRSQARHTRVRLLKQVSMLSAILPLLLHVGAACGFSERSELVLATWNPLKAKELLEITQVRTLVRVTRSRGCA